jgi:ribosomal protein S18 acetylase RimI-like enzyme
MSVVAGRVIGSAVELRWPTDLDDELGDAVHRVLHAVVAVGGAVGHLHPPDRAAVDTWLSGLLDAVRAGDAAFAVARIGGRIEAIGCWSRLPWKPFAHSAEIQKVMAHPDARGLGLGRRIVTALVERARGAGLETLLLGVRGNNHGAIELYEELGFVIHGRAPNVVEVGNERFDSVEMHLTLGRAPGVVLRGSQPGGLGSSPRRRP